MAGAQLTERYDADGRFRGLELQARMDKAEVNQWREGVEEKAKRKSVKANPAKGTGRVDGLGTRRRQRGRARGCLTVSPKGRNTDL